MGEQSDGKQCGEFKWH